MTRIIVDEATQEIAASVSDIKEVLSILKDHMSLIDNLQRQLNLNAESHQKQINLLQEQIKTLANMHNAEPKNVIDAREGLAALHTEALGPERSSKGKI